MYNELGTFQLVRAVKDDVFFSKRSIITYRYVSRIVAYHTAHHLAGSMTMIILKKKFGLLNLGSIKYNMEDFDSNIIIMKIKYAVIR